ncbi:MAG TPA: iron-containing alcohol dehydrogenase, partial [Candidatus Pygmaiobacter gallistercoris]|nr:iron-containing alcohol dehydrogenase [Candidatus Pygmaiobacter gallistercoris]
GIKDFAPHQLGHELSARFDVAHGASLSAVWGGWADFCLPSDPGRFARLGREVFGLSGGEETALARQAVDAMVGYFAEIGMPTCFSELGIGVKSEEELAAMARGVTFDGARRIGSFVSLGGEEILEIYRRCNH